MYIQPSTVHIGGWSGPRSWVVIVVQPVRTGIASDYYFEHSRPPYLLLLYWHQFPSVVTDKPIPMALGSGLSLNRFLKQSSNIQIRATTIKGNPNPNPSPSPPFQIPHVKRCLKCGLPTKIRIIPPQHASSMAIRQVLYLSNPYAYMLYYALLSLIYTNKHRGTSSLGRGLQEAFDT